MATYTKLRDGSWAVRGGSAELVPGATITVTKRDGSTRTETIGRVLWTDGTNAVASIGRESQATQNSPQPRAPNFGGAGRKPTRCRECKGPIRNAPHHRAMGGLCGECAFDEYDC